MTEFKSYKDLIVWQKAMLLAVEVYELTKRFPDSERFGLIQQIRRASVSIPSNIAEGWGRNSTGSFIQFLRISTGSICETETQISLAEMLGYLKKEEMIKANGLLLEVSKMLKALIDKLEKK